MKIVCLADTHNRLGKIKVPDGDLLAHAGDLTIEGRPGEVARELDVMAALPHAYKVLVAGNHDWLFQKEPGIARAMCQERNITYLQDSYTEIGDLSVFGSPWQPAFGDWAFNLPRGEALAERWRAIPQSLDLLITHGPPFLVLDEVKFSSEDGFKSKGCRDLAVQVAKKKPRLHLFGHIHEGYGQKEINGTKFVNASICDSGYRAVRDPVVVEL